MTVEDPDDNFGRHCLNCRAPLLPRHRDKSSQSAPEVYQCEQCGHITRVFVNIPLPRRPVLGYVLTICWHQEKPSDEEVEAYLTLFPETGSYIPFTFTELKKSLSRERCFELLCRDEDDAKHLITQAQALGLNARVEFREYGGHS